MGGGTHWDRRGGLRKRDARSDCHLPRSRGQLTPNTSFTPGLQVIANPSFNVSKNAIGIPSVKFRVSF
jgi:hypothetical protein